MYPTEMQLKKVSSIDNEAAVLILNLLISNGLFQLKSLTNAMILILTFLVYRFWIATFLVPPLVVFTFLSLFGLQGWLVVWLSNARNKTCPTGASVS